MLKLVPQRTTKVDKNPSRQQVHIKITKTHALAQLKPA